MHCTIAVEKLAKYQSHTEINSVDKEMFTKLKTTVEGCLIQLRRIQLDQAPEKNTKPSALQGSDPKQSSDAKRYIMLSYNWEQQETVRIIKDAMKSERLETWFDEENMPAGSLLESMGQAIDDASLVCIFFSDGYKKSPNCRTEAEYAYKKRKSMLFVKAQPNYVAEGWLGTLLGMELYYDITGDFFKSGTQKLIQSIHTRLGENLPSAFTKGDIVSHHDTKLNAPSKGVCEPALQAKAEKCNPWGTEDVSKWLQQLKLDSLQQMY